MVAAAKVDPPEKGLEYLMWIFVILFIGLMVLGYDGHDYVAFSNDGPLGQIKAQAAGGEWQDLNGIGTVGGGASPSFENEIIFTGGLSCWAVSIMPAPTMHFLWPWRYDIGFVIEIGLIMGAFQLLCLAVPLPKEE